MRNPIAFRQRVLLALLPSLVLTTVLGSVGLFLLHRLGGSIDVILRENYESVIAMQDLMESLEHMDSSLQRVLIASKLQDQQEKGRQDEQARKEYEKNWPIFDAALRKEQNNITIHPIEDQLVGRLAELSESFRQQGTEFLTRAGRGGVEQQDYYGKAGIRETSRQLRQVADDILQLNQKEMKKASEKASYTAATSMIWLGIGLAVAVGLSLLLSWHTVRTVLHPIQAMTQAATEISAGNLDQVVPYLSRDELGQLAQAFNNMARKLRDLRQSQMSRLLRAQRTSQASIDSFPDPIVVVDTEGYVEMANPAAHRVLGVQAQQADGVPSGVTLEGTGQMVRIAWQPPEALRKPLTAAIQAQRPYLPDGFDRAVALQLDGQEHFFLPRILPIRDPYGATLGAAVLLQDVTRFRLLDEIKSNLVATVSHELKTPLTSVRLAVHLLLEEAVGSLTAKQTELLLDARENAELLLARVNNLLDLTRLERGREQLDIRAEPTAELLRAAADAVRPKASDKGVDVTVEASPDLPPVAADAARLAHALGNVLENAVTYTEPGGQVTLSAAPADDRSVTLSITDTGAGIPPEHLPHVFERFFRVPGQSRGSGTGLGLAIAREIVTAHGGTITCESRPGAGTVFRLTLPVWMDAAAGPESADDRERTTPQRV